MRVLSIIKCYVNVTLDSWLEAYKSFILLQPSCHLRERGRHRPRNSFQCLAIFPLKRSLVSSRCPLVETSFGVAEKPKDQAAKSVVAELLKIHGRTIWNSMLRSCTRALGDKWIYSDSIALSTSDAGSQYHRGRVGMGVQPPSTPQPQLYTQTFTKW